MYMSHAIFQLCELAINIDIRIYNLEYNHLYRVTLNSNI